MVVAAELLSTPFLIVAWIAIVLAIILAYVYGRRATRIRSRLISEHDAQFEPLAPVPDEGMSWMGRWLFLAGFRRPSAVALFMATSAAALFIGAAAALTISVSALMADARDAIYELPGGIGTMLDPALLLIPWFFFLIISLAPWLYVRSERRRRIREIEEDLPITLQLLATLSRAGLGFDAALLRVLDSGDKTRTLSAELTTFRRENMSGIPRDRCWRRLARRVEIPSISVFVAAMIHAEQVGGGVANVLEHQTEDVQGRRREQAMIKAQSLPVKLVFPLVICFLPGIFVWTLGPAFYQFIQLIDGVMRSTQGT